MYHTCWFNSHFNTITDGLCACIFAAEIDRLPMMLSFCLPRKSDSSRSSIFWTAGNMKFARFLHYRCTCHTHPRTIYNCQNRNVTIKNVKDRSKVDLDSGLSLTWKCFHDKFSRQMWKRVGRLGSFQLLLFVGSTSTK